MRPGIESRSPGPLASTLLTGPMSPYFLFFIIIIILVVLYLSDSCQLFITFILGKLFCLLLICLYSFYKLILFKSIPLKERMFSFHVLYLSVDGLFVLCLSLIFTFHYLQNFDFVYQMFYRIRMNEKTLMWTAISKQIVSSNCR